MKTNAPYQARELADQAAFMRVIALTDGAEMTAKARMELIDAVAVSIVRMINSNTEHWKRVIAAQL